MKLAEMKQYIVQLAEMKQSLEIQSGKIRASSGIQSVRVSFFLYSEVQEREERGVARKNTSGRQGKLFNWSSCPNKQYSSPGVEIERKEVNQLANGQFISSVGARKVQFRCRQVRQSQQIPFSSQQWQRGRARKSSSLLVLLLGPFYTTGERVYIQGTHGQERT